MSDAAHQAPVPRRKSQVGGKQCLVRYFDVALVVLAAPIVLLLGAPAAGYPIGSAGWVLLRLFGAAVDRRASAVTHWSEQVALRLSYRSLRLVLLAAATLLALTAGGKQDGLTALAVIVVAFTLQRPASLRHGPRSPGSTG
jgi:hypothetical protein